MPLKLKKNKKKQIEIIVKINVETKYVYKTVNETNDEKWFTKDFVKYQTALLHESGQCEMLFLLQIISATY